MVGLTPQDGPGSINLLQEHDVGYLHVVWAFGREMSAASALEWTNSQKYLMVEHHIAEPHCDVCTILDSLAVSKRTTNAKHQAWSTGITCLRHHHQQHCAAEPAGKMGTRLQCSVWCLEAMHQPQQQAAVGFGRREAARQQPQLRTEPAKAGLLQICIKLQCTWAMISAKASLVTALPRSSKQIM